MGRFARSYALTVESWNVLRSDKSLILFPLISAAASLLIFLSFAVPIGLALWSHRDNMEAVTSNNGYRAAGLLFSFLFYFINFSVANYCNVALVGCALERFEGRPASIAIGLRIANSRLPQIFMWSAVAATVGMILRAIEERAGFLGRIVIGLIGMAWAIATFFVIPILVVEGVGPIDALRRSVGIIKKTWGESIIVTVSVNLILGILMVVGVIILVAAVIGAAMLTSDWPVPAVVGVIGAIALVLLALVGSTLKEIVNAALYRYATTGVVPAGFSATSMQGVFAPKK